METDQHDVSNASEGTPSVSGNSLSSGGVTMVCSTDCHVEKLENPLVANPLNENHIYRQDVVRRNDGSMIGVVTEVAGDSDSESGVTDDEDDDDKEEENGEEEGEEEREEEEDGNVKNEGSDKVRNEDANESSDDNRSCGNDRRDPLIADQLRVLWMDDSETTHHRRELTVVDRGFLHGDYVASALDPTGQVGLVVDVNISVDLLAPDGSVVTDVPSRDLKRVRYVTVGDYVVFGPWLGRVDDVLDNVTVIFDDGSVCKVMRAEPLRLRPIAKNLLEDGHCPYHPGQRIWASSSAVFRSALWLSGTWKASRLEGTVIKVTVGLVYVHWIASAGYGPESSISPAEEQNPKNLKLLSCFTHANWQLGDWCFLPSLALSSTIALDKGFSKLQLQESNSGQPESYAEEVIPEESNENVESMDLDGAGAPEAVDRNGENNVSLKSSSCGSSLSVGRVTVHESWHIHRKKLRKVVVKRDKKVRKKENFERALMFVNTRTRVDVAWQDGTVELGLNSTVLIPIENPGDHDFVAEQYVLEKAVDDNDETSEVRRVGIVKSVNAKEKTACVKWLKQVTRPEDPREFDTEEIASVYELEGHPDFDYCYGDVVVRLSPVSIAVEGACSDSEEDHGSLNVSSDVKQDSKRYSDDKVGNGSSEGACNDFSDLSWVGNITGLRNGDIEVTWADGMVSTVGPQAVYVVGRDDDESIIGGSEVSDVASWETVEDDEMDALENTGKGNPVKVRRPSDYNPSLAATLGPSQPHPNLNLAAVGLTPGLTDGLERPDCIFLEGLPNYFTKAQIREILESFGSLRGFDLVKARETGNSKGYAFCVYQDPSVTDVAYAALNGIKMGNKKLTVRRANQGAAQPKPNAQQQIMLQEQTPEVADINLEAVEDISVGDRSSVMNGPLVFPLAAIGFVTRLASGIFSHGRGNEDLFGSDSSGGNEKQLQEEIYISDGRDSCSMPNSQDPGVIDVVDGQTNLLKGKKPVDSKSEKLVDAAEALCDLRPKELDAGLCSDDIIFCFKRFDTAKDPMDHFFLSADVPVNSGRKWLKKVQGDWNILQNNLPDGIYVRVYEDRMDLLRAVIVGAYGTPYQDGLFFFDFHLPPEYPDVPPSAHYHSGGWRINPNLYEEGKVCLSLLNTWTGRGNEVWDPQSSSILQVLVSLQGLVLNSKPYFNEAGYDKQIGTAEGEKNSLSYNENTFLLNCKTIMYLIRKPPKDFENFVKEHFKRCGYYILKACDAYMKGYLIGSLSKDASVTEKSEANATSVGFKLMLAKIVPKLFSSLSGVGADCHELKHLLQL